MGHPTPTPEGTIVQVSFPISHGDSDAVTADEFKGAFRQHPGGVALITAEHNHTPVALTATSVFSVSVDPHLVVFSISDTSSSSPVVKLADTVVIHLLGADQLHLAKLGATSGIDRFADTSLWTRLHTGEPVFHEAPTWIRARVLERLSTGTATVIVAEALRVSLPGTQDAPVPLVYHDRTWHQLGEASMLRA